MTFADAFAIGSGVGLLILSLLYITKVFRSAHDTRFRLKTVDLFFLTLCIVPVTTALGVWLLARGL